MTVVVNNASSTFVRALREMAKLDGASGLDSGALWKPRGR